MDRRSFIRSSAAVAGATLMNSSMASSNKHKMPADLGKAPLKNSEQKKLIASTVDCIEKGRTCLTHCAKELAKGDPMMAKCNLAVQNMLAACEGLNKVAHLNSLDSKSFKSFVKGCQLVCEQCYVECKKHKDHHAECKACMKSCEECIEICKKLS